MTSLDDYADGVYEKSELFRYYKEIGIVDSEEINESIIFAEDLNEKKDTNLLTKNFQWRYQTPDYLKRLLSYKDVPYLHAAVESILKSMLMIREDSYHVEHIKSQAEIRHCHNGSSPSKYHLHLLLLGTLCVFCGLPLKYICRTFILLATVFTIVYIWRKCHALCMNRKLKKLKQLLLIQNEMIHLVKKSLCLLRARSSTKMDPEIYKTGFFLQSSRVDKSEFLEHFSTIPMLRSCLSETVLNVTKYIHSVTKNMIETLPLLSQVDDTNGYLCSSNWSDLGVDELLDNCNGIVTIETLQRLTALYVIIQSEFLRRLSLSLCPEMWLKYTRKVKNSVWVIVENVLWEITRNSFKLMKNYWLYCGYEKRRNFTTKKLQPQQMFCHNVDLFQTFQEWFLTVQEISNCVGFCIREIENENFKEDKNYKSQLGEILEEVMLELGTLLKKSNSHFEISFKKLKKYCNNSSVEGKKENAVSIKENENKCCEMIPVGYSDLDPEVEDEVFEDIVFLDPQTKDEELESAMIIEETKNKIRRKHCTLLFSELKNALANRAEKTQEREAKALQKKKLQVLEYSKNYNFYDELHSEQSKDKTVVDEFKDLCPNVAGICTDDESLSDFSAKLSCTNDFDAGSVKDIPKCCHFTRGNSQVIQKSEECCENKNTDFLNKLPRFRNSSDSSEYEHTCNNVYRNMLCESETFHSEELSSGKHNITSSDDYEGVKKDNCCIGKNVSSFQSSLFAEMAIKAAEFASAAQQVKLSPTFLTDTGVQKSSMGNAPSFAQNTTQQMEETFAYDPDEEI